MNKIFILLMVSVIIAGSTMLGCAQPAPSPSTEPAPAPSTIPDTTEVVNLIVSTADPGPAGGPVSMEAVCNEIKDATNGKMTFEMYVGGALGKSVEQYDLAVEGTADIILINPAYLSGRFPMHEIVELPLIFPGDGVNATRVAMGLHEMFPEMLDDFADVKVLVWSPLGARKFQMVEPVETIADLKGKKIRVTGSIPTETVTLTGAVPVAMPPSEIYTSIERGTLDGSLFEWEGYNAFKLWEVAKYTTMVDIATTSHLVVMNKEKYNSLPADVKAVFDEYAGAKASQVYAQVMYDMDRNAYDKIIEGGQVLVEVSAAEKAKFEAAVKPQRDQWAADMDAKGFPGTEMVNAALEMSAEYK